MDKTLQQQLYGGLSRSSSNGSRSRMSLPAMSAPKPISGSALCFNATPVTIKKVALNNSRLSISARSNQSFNGIKSDFNVVESYGGPLPVAINEALMFKSTVSAKCSPNGWAWVVQGRRVVTWQYKDNSNTGNSRSRSLTPQQRRSVVNVSQCRELLLPHCDIGHKAELVSVYNTEGQPTASCIAVSATGDVRYWPSIAHDGTSVDITNLLEGQEFDKLLNLPEQNGYLAVTTTCNLVFLQVQLNKGRHVLYHKAIKQPSSFLGGFGKKFASILIGMNSNDEKEQNFIAMACEGTENDETKVVLLSDRCMQRWSLTNKGQTEQLLCEDSDIVRKIRDEFKLKFWHMRMHVDSFDITLHFLDMQIVKNKIYVLAGAVNESHTPQMYYGIAVLTTENEQLLLDNFIPLKLSKFYSPTTDQDCINMRFIVNRTHLYIYTSKVVYPLHIMDIAPSTELEAEKVEFHLHDDRILSAVVCGHIAIFFSRTHGLVSVTPGDFDNNDLMNMSTCNLPDMFSTPVASVTESFLEEQAATASTHSLHNLHLFELDTDDIRLEKDDDISQLKVAFVYHLKRNINGSNAIINELLKSIAERETAASTLNNEHTLDKIIIQIAEDLAEDIPFADPRWEEIWEKQNANRAALGSSRSMQILTQLKDKHLALQHFIEFLHTVGIWAKLTAVPNVSGMLKPTSYILCDINEKIIAAIALRSLQNNPSKIIEEAIEHVVAVWNEEPQGNLTAQDIFYVKLCRFQNIFQAFGDVIDARIGMQHNTISLAHCINEINGIILDVIAQVFKFREENAHRFMLPADKLESYEYLPWTAMTGSVGVRDTLSRLVEISVRYGAHCASEAELKQKLYQQILQLIDIILDGRKSYLESVRDTEKFSVLQQQFESQRRELISILIDNEQYEFAAKLAEKYLDFQSLVIICDLTNNQDRLDEYIKKYEEFDFSQFAINWHLRQNRRGEVFKRFKGNQNALAQFMRDHPSLGWIQLVFNGDFERAAKTLFQLAQAETEFVQRKKSMLSLAKMASLAAGDSELSTQVDNINVELTIIEYQEQLGQSILNAFGYDVGQQKVLKVEEIINLYVSEENDAANELDFRKALELLNYLDEPEELRHKIWSAAILRDNWTEYDANNAVDYVQNLLFFKLIELCHLMDGECDTFLPPMEDFMHTAELGELTRNKAYQYLLKLTYEYVTEAFKSNDEQMEL